MMIDARKVGRTRVKCVRSVPYAVWFAATVLAVGAQRTGLAGLVDGKRLDKNRSGLRGRLGAMLKKNKGTSATPVHYADTPAVSPTSLLERKMNQVAKPGDLQL